MEIFDCRPAAEARRRLEQYTKRKQADGFALGAGIVEYPTGGAEGYSVLPTDCFVLLVEGEAVALTHGGVRAQISPGQAASWRGGEWYALELTPGSEYLRVEGRRTLEGGRLNPYDLCVAADAEGSESAPGTTD